MRHARPVNPIFPLAAALAWTTLGLRWMETMAASGQVIVRRTRREPTAAQWGAWGNEKARAAFDSGNAMWGAWARMLTAGLAPYRARAVRNARRLRRR